MKSDRKQYEKPKITKNGDLKSITKSKTDGYYDGDGPGWESG